ncbi:MAG: Hsp70 family protein [Chloroflexota bacterium]
MQQRDLAVRQNTPFVLGIDLGTTNSLLAIARADDPSRYLPPQPGASHGEDGPFAQHVRVDLMQLPQRNLDGTTSEDVMFPSVVYQSSDGNRLVGLGARDARFKFRRGRQVFYSVKRDLGIDRHPFYPSAVSSELDDPVKVSSTILRSMKQAAEAKLGCSLASVPTVITVPASFQSAQRRDTLRAAVLAGLDVAEDSLFDEPNAALLAFINRRGAQTRWNQEETVLIFDFGGGTCDVSVIDVSFAPVSRRVHLRNLAISRFEQLGGDDIDQHLVHTYLKEMFYQRSGTTERDWGFGERRFSIWSQLARIAELLKVRLCNEVDKEVQTRGWPQGRARAVEIAMPPQPINTSRGVVTMDKLTLDFARLSDAMAPFLDPGCAQNKDHEYYRITSIFSPILDALNKANLNAQDVTRVLLVGGSSRNPFVEHAVETYFKSATVDRPNDMDMLVAEGAALHAFFHYELGHDVLAPIVGDTIGILTQGRVFVPLVPAGASIPFPPDGGWQEYNQFRVPNDLMSHVDLIVCTGGAERPVHTIRLDFDSFVPRNQAVNLRVRLDGNKIMHVEASIADYPGIHVMAAIDNPLGLVPMTPTEQKRARLEKVLSVAQSAGTLDQHIDEMVNLAGALWRLQRYEGALEWIELAIRRHGQATADMLALKGYIHFDLREYPQAYAVFRDLAAQDERSVDFAYMAGLAAPDPASMLSHMRKAQTANPNHPLAHYGLGLAYEQQGDFPSERAAFASAAKLFEGALQLNPRDRQALSFLAAIYQRLGEEQKAAEMSRRYEEVSAEGISVDTSHGLGLTNELVAR